MKSVTEQIREIAEDELGESLAVIRKSFQTVAVELDLTPENCPTHPAFTTYERLSQLKSKGLRFFGLFLGNRQVGFVTIEKADNNLYYMEKLAVLPEYRHKGYGRELVDYAINYVRNNGGKILSIGIIDKQTVLKNWYKEIGFREMSTKEFEHLPFTVCFMDLAIIQAK